MVRRGGCLGTEILVTIHVRTGSDSDWVLLTAIMIGHISDPDRWFFFRITKGENMSVILNEVLSANEAYAASFGDKKDLALPPARGFTILTCMDAGLDPAKYAGLSEGDAHVIRNAGGRASDDAIRSMVISYKLLGTKEFFVIHHTDCGMEFFTNEVMSGLLANSLETAALDENGFHDVGTGGGSPEGKYMNFLTISDQQGSVVEVVKRVRNHPLVPKSIPVYGYLYDVKSGKLIEIERATEAGKAA